jgi:hypothetical protein
LNVYSLVVAVIGAAIFGEPSGRADPLNIPSRRRETGDEARENASRA